MCHVYSSSFKDLPGIVSVEIEVRLVARPSCVDDSQMIYPDVSLDCVIMLTLPGSGCFIQIEVIAQAKLPRISGLDFVNVMDDDFAPDVHAVRIAV